MPNKQAAWKHLRQTKKRTVVNRGRKDALKSLLKKTQKGLAGTDGKEQLRQAMKAIDKAAQRGIMKKTTAARKKSRLAKRYAALTKASAA